jgi:RHS repeat-associated protein
MARTSRGFAVGLIALVTVASASAQIAYDTTPQTTPTPGDGHNYLKMLSETVSPADGSLSLKISLPTPPARGFTLPFAYTYSSSAPFMQPVSPGQQTWGYFRYNINLAKGAWSTTLPWLSASFLQYNNPLYPTANPCFAFTNYVFHDPSGGTHALGLAAAGTTSQTQACAGVNWSSYSTAHDDFVQATLSVGSPSGTQTNPPNPGSGSVYVADAQSTAYKFNGSPWGGRADNNPADTTAEGSPATIEDRNGNVVTLVGAVNIIGNAAPTSIVDSTGRTELSFSGGLFGSVTVAGVSVPYSQTWIGKSASSVALHPVQLQSDAYCTAIPNFNALLGYGSVLSILTLPNGQHYTFTYDPAYGLLSKITYPDGGYVSYVWGLNPQSAITSFPDRNGLTNGCVYKYDHPAVVKRFVSFDGATNALEQDFSYSTTWSGFLWTNKTTTVTTKDLVAGTTSTTIYSFGSVTLQMPPDTNWPQVSNTIYQQVPTENTITVKDGNLNVMHTTTKLWTDQYTVSCQFEQLDTGALSGIYYGYGSGHVLTDKQEYDYGQISSIPSNCLSNGITPVRETQIAYQSFASTPNYSYAPSILDRPATVSTYGNGTLAAQTTYAYDQSLVAGVSNLPTGTHDETNYGTSTNPPRGNATTVTRKCLGCTDASTTSTFDEAGQTLSVIDPCGNTTCSDVSGANHTTTYSYADSYTVLSGGQNVPYTPSANTDTFVTRITDPLGHSASFAHDYGSGQLTQLTDQNGQSTTYIYNDSLSRPTQANFPDGGQTEYSYSDTLLSPSITSCQRITGALGATCSSGSPPAGWKTSIAVMDGLSHTTQTQLLSDPDGTDTLQTTYNGLAQVYTRSNPHRSSASGTDGTTTYAYDALGRPTTANDPDGSVVTTTYSGNQTTVTDEAGKQRRSQTDAFGRLTRVWEAPNVTGYNLESDYQYDALGNLICAVQKGTDTTAFSSCASSPATWRPRSFVYDSLSRLTSSANPESGTITYAYDANGNLASRIAPQPNQTGTATVTTNYTYDALNRLTAKTYVGMSTAGGKYGYDGVALSGCTTMPPSLSDSNPIGLRTAMCDGSGATSWKHDSMGRVLTESRIIIGTSPWTKTAGYTYNFDGSIATINNPGVGRVMTYTTTSAGRQSSVVNTGGSINFVTNATYAPPGELATYTNGGTVNTTNTYNSRLQPVTLSSATTGSTSIMNLTYDFHAASHADSGNVYQIANGRDNNRTQNFIYDPLNRIQQAYTTGNSPLPTSWGETFSPTATGPGVPPSTPGIDVWGNLTNRSGVTGKTMTEPLSAAATTQNRLIGFGYDAAGNMISNGSATYTYDAENRLVSTAGWTYFYDGDGHRVRKSSGSTGTLYWLDLGGNTLNESSLGATNLHEYVYFAGKRVARIDVPAPLTVKYYFSDHLGSADVITDSSGSILRESDYYPYGGEISITNNDGNNYKFTGKERDSESGLDNFGARYDASSLGRFMTPDWAARPTAVPYALFGDPQSLNLYGYVRNDPVSRADADGHYWGGAAGACASAQSARNVLTTTTCAFGEDQRLENAQNEATTEAATQQHGSEPSSSRSAIFTSVVLVDSFGRQSSGASKGSASGLDYKDGIPPATGKLLDVLVCTQNCASGMNLTVTSTHEALPNGQHGPDTPHGRSEAADLRVKKGNEGKVLQCAANCGAKFGLNERLHPSGPGVRPHVHVQTVPGTQGGQGDLPDPDN